MKNNNLTKKLKLKNKTYIGSYDAPSRSLKTFEDILKYLEHSPVKKDNTLIIDYLNNIISNIYGIDVVILKELTFEESYDLLIAEINKLKSELINTDTDKKQTRHARYVKHNKLKKLITLSIGVTTVGIGLSILKYKNTNEK